MAPPLQGDRTEGGSRAGSQGGSETYRSGVTSDVKPKKIGDGAVRVFPDQVEFKDIEVGVTHLIVITVQNAGNKPRRVRFLPPKTKEFVLHHEPTTSVAAGLEVHAEIEFKTDSEKDCHDRIVVLSDGNQIEVPLHAFVACPNIDFDGFVNFGPVVSGTTSSRNVELKNKGSRSGSFNFVYDSTLPIRISPKTGSLDPVGYPNNSTTVKVDFSGIDTGVFRALAQVDLAGQPQRMLDINSVVVEQSLELVHPHGGGAVKALNFGALYYGEQRSMQCLLVNNGPQPCSFFIAVTGDDDPAVDVQSTRGSSAGGRTVDMGMPPPLVTATPTEATLFPYSQIEVEFVYKPRKPAERQGWRSSSTLNNDEEMQLELVIDVLETKQKMEYPVTGKAMKPLVSASQSVFKFPQTKVHDHLDIPFTIKNENADLPIEFSIGRVAHFHTKPGKGRLLPLQSQTVMATFCPNQLGNWKVETNVSVNKGLLEIPLHFFGKAFQIGDKKALVGGLDALDVDFVKPKKFVEPRDTTRPPKEPEAKPQKTSYLDSLVEVEVDNSEDAYLYTFTVGELKDKRDHRKKYNDYLTSQRDDRLMKKAKDLQKMLKLEDIGVPVTQLRDVEVDPISGLRQPKLGLPPPVDPLWLVSNQQQSGPKPLTRLFDEDRLFKKKFKPQPTTNAEIRDCKATLTQKELLWITSGPRSINFNSISVFSENVKGFTVNNGLKQNVLVSLELSNVPELAKSTPKSQVVPAGASAGFDIIFQSQKVQNFYTTVEYVINGQHPLKFAVEAEVSPVVLDLSSSDLSFHFSDVDLDLTVTESLTIHNPGNCVADFSWDKGDGMYLVSPPKGTVDAGGSTTVQVIYTPNANVASTERTLTMNVKGGPPQLLRCVGEQAELRCSFIEKKLDFGEISVGLPMEKTVNLKNLGGPDIVYKFESPLTGLNVTPSKGRISSGQVAQLQVTLKASSPQPYETYLVAQLRGGKSIKLLMIGEAITPEIEVEEDEFDFQGVLVGASSSKSVTIHNMSNIDSQLTLDLSRQPEFTVYQELGQIEEDEDADEDDNPIQPLDSLSLDYNSDQEVPADQGQAYSLKVKANGTLRFNLMYRPTKLESVAFELPLSLTGVAPNPKLRRAVAGEGMKPRLKLSTTVMQFENKVVTRERLKAPYVETLVLTNEDSQSLMWELDVSKLPKDIFTIEPCHGNLALEQSRNVRISFQPHEAKTYECKVPIYLGKNTSKAYLELVIRGIAHYPRLTFDRTEIILDSVPLGVKSTTRFEVFNEGYDNLELQYRLPLDTARIPLSLEFPEGKVVGVTKSSIPVEISFTTQKAMSFAAKVDFLDLEGNRFSIPVCGTADNCILTSQDYLAANKQQYEIVGVAGKPITLAAKELDGVEQLSMQMDEGKAKKKDEMLTPTQRMKRSLPTLLRWMNVCLSRVQIDNFPQDLYASKAKTFSDIIEALSGKKINAKKGNVKEKDDTAAKKSERAQKNLQYMEELVTFLKAHGALLNHIKPELLLPFDDYQRVVSARDQIEDQNDANSEAGPSMDVLAMRKQKRRQLERLYPDQSSGAWQSVMYQVIKLFVLSRVNLKQFKALPNVSDDGTDSVITGSNLYSVPENLLLKWLNSHYNKANPDDTRRIVNFESDLKDSRVLAAAILAHVPSAVALTKLKTECKNPADYQWNAEKVVNVIKELGFDYNVAASEIANPDGRDLLLLVMFLYQVLPQYIPKTTIEFVGKLSEKLVKYIELTNPSKRAIVYNVRLEGSEDFQVPSDSVRLEPKATVQFPVEFVGRFSRPAEARLIFTSNKESGAQGMTLVFKLKSRIEAIKPIRTVTVETPMYEMCHIDLPVNCPFTRRCRPSININWEKIVDVPQIPKGAKATKKQLAQQAAAQQALAEQKQQQQAMRPEEAPFWTRAKSVDLQPGENNTVKVPIQFLPIELANFKAQVLFVDENVGEFAYEVYGNTILPEPCDRFRFQVEPKHCTKDISVPYENPSLLRAKTMLAERSIIHAPSSDKRKRDKKKPQITMPTGDIDFKVEYVSPFFAGPNDVRLTDAPPTSRRPVREKEKDKESEEGGPKKTGPNRFTLDFSPKVAGVYPGKIVMKSANDVRVYEVEFTASVMGLEASLDFMSPVRTTVTQDIPIVNNTDKPWPIKATITGKCFTGPKEATVQPLSTYTYPLVFRPVQAATETGQLVITNTATKEQYTYSLKGHGEDPLAEDHIIIECQTRETVTQSFRVFNVYGTGEKSKNDVKYKVESDLPNVVGDAEVVLKKGQEVTYELSIRPNLGGIYNGSVSFTTSDGTFIWYTVEIRSAPPPAEKTIEVSSVLRKAVQVDISISNPSNEPVEFDVVLAGHGLLGKDFLLLGPRESAVYELVYSPVIAGTTEGSVSFLSDTIGEFWYELKLTGIVPPPEEIPLIECEIGQRKKVEMEIDNPIAEEVTLKCSVSNSRNYSVKPSPFVLGPLQKGVFEIEYQPSSLDTDETGEVTLSHPSCGQWVYLVKGRGLPPTMMEPVVINAPLGNSASAITLFRNPFNYPLTVSIIMDTESKQAAAFNLLLKKTMGISVPAFTSVQLPVAFSPESMAVYKTTVSVVVNEQLKWIYPVHGIAESPTAETSFHFSCKARSRLEETIDIELAGLDSFDDEEFDQQVTVTNEANRVAIDRSFAVTPLGMVVKDGKNILQYKVVFEPLKPIKADAEFFVSKRSGGRWRFEFQIEATQPEVDDEIVLEGTVNQTSSVSFKITNQFPTFVEYRAFFTANSDPTFTIYPPSGLLEPLGSEGTTFYLSYTPIEYGKTSSGKLVIQTDEMQWTYDVKGTHPKYRVPEVETKLDTKLPDVVSQVMGANKAKNKVRNFMRDNIENPKTRGHMPSGSIRGGNSTRSLTGSRRR